jgi:hypothetical protein
MDKQIVRTVTMDEQNRIVEEKDIPVPPVGVVGESVTRKIQELGRNTPIPVNISLSIPEVSSNIGVEVGEYGLSNGSAFCKINGTVLSQKDIADYLTKKQSGISSVRL